MIPNYSPPLLGDGDEDGDGFSLVMYADLENYIHVTLKKKNYHQRFGYYQNLHMQVKVEIQIKVLKIIKKMYVDME